MGRGGDEGDEGESREGDERFKFGMKRSPPPPAYFPQGAARVFGLSREGITPPRDELDPVTGGQTSYYIAQAPYPHYQQIGPATVPLIVTIC